MDDVRENGDDTLHNVTVSSSVGDITIDSVKDHLGSGESLTRQLANLTVTKTVTTINSNQVGDDVTTTSNTTTTTTTTQQENSTYGFRFVLLFEIYNTNERISVMSQMLWGNPLNPNKTKSTTTCHIKKIAQSGNPDKELDCIITKQQPNLNTRCAAQ